MKGFDNMKCPFCGFNETKVVDSRPADERKRRRRECSACGKRFTTYEIVEKPLLMVQKKDSSFEPFDKNKLIGGIFSAIKKRPITMKQVIAIVDSIENHYANEMRTLVTSSEIGDMVLEKLKLIDPVSYIRFASVYKEFTDVDSFIKAISELGRKYR